MKEYFKNPHPQLTLDDYVLASENFEYPQNQDKN
jgi:hypothetical protein